MQRLYCYDLRDAINKANNTNWLPYPKCDSAKPLDLKDKNDEEAMLAVKEWWVINGMGDTISFDILCEKAA